MGVGNIDVVDLDKFILECDRLGGPQHPDVADYLSDFSINFKTHVDENLDPFSDEYFCSQISLYQEISGRLLNQEDGEQTQIEVNSHALGVNPYNSNDINFISKHARAVLAAIHIATAVCITNWYSSSSGQSSSSTFPRKTIGCPGVTVQPEFLSSWEQIAE